MLRFHAMSFTAVINNVALAESGIGLLFMQGDQSAGTELEASILHLVRDSMEGVVKEIEELPVTDAIKTQAGRLSARLAGNLHTDIEKTVAISLIQELKHNILHDLSGHYCVMITKDRRYLYAQTSPLFGPEVASRFPSASRDIASAGQCLALDQWTAAVFHLMRVLEHGLRELAAKLQVTFPAGIEFENWKNVIDKIEKEIRQIEQQPKGPQKSEDLEFYTKAASQFWHFKEAWRNHVSHSRATYDETEATQVFNAVSAFMRQLATRA